MREDLFAPVESSCLVNLPAEWVNFNLFVWADFPFTAVEPKKV